jgi:hypothetical protein
MMSIVRADDCNDTLFAGRVMCRKRQTRMQFLQRSDSSRRVAESECHDRTVRIEQMRGAMSNDSAYSARQKSADRPRFMAARR